MTGPKTHDQVRRDVQASFARHEHWADPEVARHLAATALARPRTPRRTVHLVPAAVILLALGTGGLAFSRERVRPGQSPTSATAAPTPATYAAHRALAAAESARVVELTPLPQGARRLSGQPDDWPQDSAMSLGPADLTLTRTAWWSVPVVAGSVERYLTSHAPAGLIREDGVGEGARGVSALTYNAAPADPGAMIGVSLLVQWLQVGDRTLLRADTFTAARAVRSPASYVGSDVNAAELDRVAAGHGRLPTVHLDATGIETVARALDGLPASIEPPFAASCPAPQRPEGSLVLTLHTSTGTLRARLRPTCWGQVHVARDGVPIAPTLDPMDLARIVDRAANGEF